MYGLMDVLPEARISAFFGRVRGRNGHPQLKGFEARRAVR